MGLRYPADLSAWQEWQNGRNRIRLGLAAARRMSRRHTSEPTPTFLARTFAARPCQVLVVLESRAASHINAVLDPIRHLVDEPVSVLAPFDPSALLPGEGWQVRPVEGLRLDLMFPDLRVVISAAHYLELGATAFADAELRGHDYVTVQHGLLTPSAPPLPPKTPFFAWSKADADFWLSDRSDATAHIVGSQLLWKSAARSAAHVSRFETPVFLGQLHGAELSRAGMVQTATTFCLETRASYRPHPSETDRLSRLQHAVWRRMGIDVDLSGRPLTDVSAPVVGAFSTGILESAARGLPAWAYHSNPPGWLTEFWQRYGMGVWGGPPTAAPQQPAGEPAAAIADWVKGRL